MENHHNPTNKHKSSQSHLGMAGFWLHKPYLPSLTAITTRLTAVTTWQRLSKRAINNPISDPIPP